MDSLKLFYLALVGLAVAQALFIYAMVLGPWIAGAVLLFRGRRKIACWLIAVGMLPIGYFTVRWIDATRLPAQRAEEIRSWPQATISAGYPHTLVIRSARDKLQPYGFFLAETGLFDVYAILGFGNQKTTVWHLDVKRSDDCRKSRNERTEMLGFTGWLACAVATPVAAAPEDGLFLYDDKIVAPHSWYNAGRAGLVDYTTAWTLELAIRRDSESKIVAYDEFLMFPELRFDVLYGPRFERRPWPRRMVTRTSSVNVVPDPADFVLDSLKIDLGALTPPFALSGEDRHRYLDELAQTGNADDTRRALEIVAAPARDPDLYSVVAGLAANPVTSKQMGLPAEPRWCEKIARLMRYRDALIDGCSNSSLAPGQCGQLGYQNQWLESCADNSVPIWRGEAGPMKRVFVANSITKAKTSIVLREPAQLVVVQVPRDRGQIDLVVQNETSTVLALAGAVSCIERLTVLEDSPRTGVIGIDPARLRFAAPIEARSWIDPEAPFSGTFGHMLGMKPDGALIKNRSDSVDLGAVLGPSHGQAPCGAEDLPDVQIPRIGEDGIAHLSAKAVLTAPPLLPRNK